MRRSILILAGLAIASLAVARWTSDQQPVDRQASATRCAEIAALGHVRAVPIPADGRPDGYRNGVLTSNGCSYIGADQ